MMTLEELDRHAELRRRLKKEKELLSSLRSAVGLGAQVLTGTPRAPGYRDKLGELIPEIEDVSNEIWELEMQVQQEETELIAFIERIPDAYTRTIFRLRFFRGLPWKTVASIVGGGNSEEAVKSACYRCLSKLAPP